ncbi:MAG: monovalent cation/H+ antiporter subunit D family protein [Brevibacterium yomogidense]
MENPPVAAPVDPALLLLLVAVPLAAAALSTLVKSRTFDRTLLIGVPVFVGAAAVVLLVIHADHAVLAHSVGGYLNGLAIPFVSDSFAALLLLVTSVASVLCGWFLISTGEDQYRFVPALILMMLTGAYGTILTGDLFNMFVFVEVMVLPSYALIAVTGTWRRLGVARMFVIVNLLTSTLLLVGVGFVYGTTGTVNIGTLAAMEEIDAPGQLALGLVVVAFLIKAGAVPAHTWLVRSYPNTSAGMMALFSALHSKVAIYAIFRIYGTIFGEPPAWTWALAIVAVASILVGSLSGMAENRVRNTLAVQMTSGVGHILVGVVLLTSAALQAGIFYTVHHILTMAGLLLVFGAVEQTYGTGLYRKLTGLARREKTTAVLVVLGLFSLVGLPPTSGLWGKVGLVVAAAVPTDGESTSVMGWVLIAAIIVGSVLSLFALIRLWRGVFWGEDPDTYYPDGRLTGRSRATTLTADVRIPTRLLIPGAVLIGLSVMLFVAPQPLIDVTQRSADGLLSNGDYIRAVLGHG